MLAVKALSYKQNQVNGQCRIRSNSIVFFCFEQKPNVGSGLDYTIKYLIFRFV